ELELLVDHGAALPPQMRGLLEEQILELRLHDDWGAENPPSGGYTYNKDPCGQRNGMRPNAEMQEIVKKIIAEAKGIISKDNIKNNRTLSQQHIADCVEMLKGGISLVYPNGLPPYDVIRQRLENDSDAPPLPRAMEPAMAQLWFAGKEMEEDKFLRDFFGKNEKTKAVVKLSSTKEGRPAREPQLDPAGQASMMAYWHKRREQLKKLDEDTDDSYLNSAWADSHNLQRQFHGLENIKWRP
ncbi:Protein of unknown function DUF2870, partial [Trinorchestia longiramus]